MKNISWIEIYDIIFNGSAKLWMILSFFIIIIIFLLKIFPLIIKTKNFFITFGNYKISFEALKEQIKVIFNSKQNDSQQIKKIINQILWVDDFPENNKVIIEIMHLMGVNIECAKSTATALDFLSHKNKVDIIISDMTRIEYGNENYIAGIELAQEIRKENKDIPIYIFTSYKQVQKTKKLKMEELDVIITDSTKELMTIIFNKAMI